MSNKNKLKKDLILEVAQLQERINELEAAGAKQKQVPEMVPESANDFRQVFEYANIGLCLVNPDGELVKSQPGDERDFRIQHRRT